MRRRATRTIGSGIIGLAAALGAAGCGGGSNEEGRVADRGATVEYRPVMMAAGNVLQKQRSGKLIKMSSDWVAINEGGNEIWIPADMVLEVRMDRQQ